MVRISLDTRDAKNGRIGIGPGNFFAVTVNSKKPANQLKLMNRDRKLLRSLA